MALRKRRRGLRSDAHLGLGWAWAEWAKKMPSNQRQLLDNTALPPWLKQQQRGWGDLGNGGESCDTGGHVQVRGQQGGLEAL